MGRKPRRALHEPKQKPIRNSKNPSSKIVVPVRVGRKGRSVRRKNVAEEGIISLREQIDSLVLEQKKQKKMEVEQKEARSLREQIDSLVLEKKTQKKNGSRTEKV